MTTHIRRDGAWICGQKPSKWQHVKDRHVSFSYAHGIGKEYMFGICKECLKRYYEILDNLKDPVVIK